MPAASDHSRTEGASWPPKSTASAPTTERIRYRVKRGDTLIKIARRHGVTVLNTPGTIDAGYRGELLVLLVNLGDETVELAAGERVAQLLLQRVGLPEVVEVDELDETARGSGGFGSTGR